MVRRSTPTLDLMKQALGYLFVATWVALIVAGLVWLLPLKRSLLKRVGNLTNDELIRLAKSGDIEAQRLRKRTWWFIGVALALLFPQMFFLQYLRGQP